MHNHVYAYGSPPSLPDDAAPRVQPLVPVPEAVQGGVPTPASPFCPNCGQIHFGFACPHPELRPCVKCHRHIREGECPFCYADELSEKGKRIEMRTQLEDLERDLKRLIDKARSLAADVRAVLDKT